MNDLGVVECSYHLENTIYRSDVRQKRVPETLPCRRPLGETGDIDTGEESGYFGFRFVSLDEPVESRVRDGYTCFLGVTK